MADGNDQSGVFSRLTAIEKIVTISGAVALVFQTVGTIKTSAETAKIANKVSEVDIQLKSQAEIRERSKDYADITKDVFEAIKEIQADSVKISDRVDRLLVASAYVQVIPDADVRGRFRESVESLRQSLQSQIAAEAPAAVGEQKIELTQQTALLENLGIQLDGQVRAEKVIAAEDAASKSAEGQAPSVQSKAPNWSNYDFDIFWCQTDNADLNARGQAIAANIHRIGAKAKGRWRLRPLPALTNAQPGYGASGYQIRISSGDESTYANQLADRGNEVLAKNNIAERFRVLPSRKDTRWYISVFVCPR